MVKQLPGSSVRHEPTDDQDIVMQLHALPCYGRLARRRMRDGVARSRRVEQMCTDNADFTIVTGAW